MEEKHKDWKFVVNELNSAYIRGNFPARICENGIKSYHSKHQFRYYCKLNGDHVCSPIQYCNCVYHTPCIALLTLNKLDEVFKTVKDRIYDEYKKKRIILTNYDFTIQCLFNNLINTVNIFQNYNVEGDSRIREKRMEKRLQKFQKENPSIAFELITLDSFLNHLHLLRQYTVTVPEVLRTYFEKNELKLPKFILRWFEHKEDLQLRSEEKVEEEVEEKVEEKPIPVEKPLEKVDFGITKQYLIVYSNSGHSKEFSIESIILNDEDLVKKKIKELIDNKIIVPDEYNQIDDSAKAFCINYEKQEIKGIKIKLKQTYDINF